jgi:anti-anti-sigma regulatory factor
MARDVQENGHGHELPERRWEAFEPELLHRGRVLLLTARQRDLRTHQLIEAVQHELDILQKHPGPERVIVDLGTVAHISSAVLGCLLHFAEEQRQQGVIVAFCRLNNEITRALTLMDPKKRLLLCADRQEAARIEPDPGRWWWPFG